MGTPQPRPAVLRKARDSGLHPVTPAAAEPEPTPAASPETPTPPAPTQVSGRVLKLPVTYRLPIDLLDRLDNYVTPTRKREGQSKEAIAAEALDDWLKARGA